MTNRHETERRRPRETQLVVQSQASLTDQLRELIDHANANGLYDAADWLKRRLDRR